MILYIPRERRPLVLGVCLAIVAVAGIVTVGVRSRDKTRDVRILAGNMHQIIGEATAQETIRLIGPNARVVVVTADPQVDPTSPAANELAGFLAATNQFGKLTVVATTVLTGGKESLVMNGPQFQQLVKQHAAVDAIVSLVGAPELSAAEIQALPADRPAVVAVSGLTFRLGLKPLFQADVVQVAIVPRMGKPPAGPRPQTPREWYEYSFQVVTAKTAAQLPD